MEQKTVLPTSYIRVFKNGFYNGCRYFPTCTDEPEIEPQCAPPENHVTTCTNPPEHSILATTTQIGAKLVDDLHIQMTITTQNTPRNAAQTTYQLAPTKLLSRLLDNQEDEDEGCQQEVTHNVMVDCDVQESENDDVSGIYKSRLLCKLVKLLDHSKF